MMQDGWGEYPVDEDISIPIPNTWDDYGEYWPIPNTWHGYGDDGIDNSVGGIKISNTKSEDELTDHVDDEDEDDDDDETELREEYDPHLSFLFDDCRDEPLGYHRLREYIPNKSPPYFKRDHPDDDLFLEKLGNAQVQRRTQIKFPNHDTFVKDVVALLIWQDSRRDPSCSIRTWTTLRDMSPPAHGDSLYIVTIRAAVSMIYFFYTQDNLFKIGHNRTLDEQMNKLWDELEKLGKTMSPWDEVCKLIVELMSNKDEYSFVTEGGLAQMLWYCLGSRHGRQFLPTSVDPVGLSEKDTSQLYNDIVMVVREIEFPADFKVDEYTHWMMTFLREEVMVAELEMIYQAIGVLTTPTPVGFKPESFHFDLYYIVRRLVGHAKDKMKNQLSDVVQPLGELCNPCRYNTSPEFAEIVQIAEIRRMALGRRFIGRSHLIWAFYKLGYALPIEIRNTINVHEADEDHPPYHIYMAATKLALWSGEKTPQLVHFMFVVLHSKDIGSDGERVTGMYQDFKDFQKALESMETEVEPKSKVTVRPCGPVDSWLEGPFTA